jgi:hypothetical protein
MRRIPSWAWFLLPLACRDFVLTGLDPNTQPDLSIGIDVVRGDQSSYEVHARFQYATDAHGKPSRLFDRTFRVEGSSIRSQLAEIPGVWVYSWKAVRAPSATAADSLYFQIPMFVASGPARSIWVIPTERSESPLHVGLASGDDLHLRLAPTGTPDLLRLPGASTRWTLQLRRDCHGNDSSAGVQLEGTSDYPTELLLPWESVRSVGSDSMVACFRGLSVYRVLGAPYRVTVATAVSFAWYVNISQATKPASGFEAQDVAGAGARISHSSPAIADGTRARNQATTVAVSNNELPAPQHRGAGLRRLCPEVNGLSKGQDGTRERSPLPRMSCSRSTP